jgi:class I fructose-bisphosphate aldolase
MTFKPLSHQDIKSILGSEHESLLTFDKPKVSQDQLAVPGPDFVDNVLKKGNRNNQVLYNLQRLYGHGNLGGSGYLSIFPVDQGVEHSAGARFAANPGYFDPENIVKFALDGGCSGVASTFGVLNSCARDYAHKIPFILKVNHNQLLSYPNEFEQTLYSSVEEALNLGATAIGATVYFGSQDANREIEEIAELFSIAHEAGLATILWCYVRNNAFNVSGVNYETAADLTAQAIHLGATMGADIVKQKLPTVTNGYQVIKTEAGDYGKTDPRVYTNLLSDHPIDMARYQVLNAYAGKVPLINSGGASGNNDVLDAVRSAVINKRAGGSGLIMGRKLFQKPTQEGLEILHAVQSVYANKEVTVA